MFSSEKLFIITITLSTFIYFNLTDVIAIQNNDILSVALNHSNGFDLKHFAQEKRIIREKRFPKHWNLNAGNKSVSRKKRDDDATFYGRTKTREERWHSSFNMNRTHLEIEQAKSLTSLLVKIMDKYLNACIPIVLYDQFVESSDGVVLQTFFQVKFYLMK